MSVPYMMKAGAASVALALACAGFPAHAVLERVGPVDPSPAVGSFPAWYQDTTGIGLEFCAPTDAVEVAGGWCLLLPANVTTVPEVFPGSFFDEHFYYAASAQIGTRQAGGKAILVLAEEAAFATGAPIPGDQITFSRIRVVLNPVPATGTYRFIHPYGEQTIDAVAGDKIFFTEDVGLGCAGNFDCSLSSRLGPFLLPSATPGGAEMAALTAANPTPDTNPANFGGVLTPTAHPGNGKAYIADPARIGPVTGSTLPNFIDSTGASRNHNIFRIEGPPGAGLGTTAGGATVDWIETTNFNLMGRLFTGVMPGRVAVDRASYSNSATSRKVDVFATAVPTTQGRLPTAPRAAAVTSTLSFYDKTCGGVPDGIGGFLPPYTAPAAPVTETPMRAAGSLMWAQTQPAVIPTEVCVKDSTTKDAAGTVIPVYVPKVVTDEVTVTKAFFEPTLGTLAVDANSSEQVSALSLTLAYGTFRGDLVGGQIVVPNLLVPPSSAAVQSTKKGVTQYQVSTGFAALPAANLPVATNDSFTFPMATVAPVAAISLDVLANDLNATGGTLALTTAPGLGSASVVAGKVNYTPNLNASGTDTFSYTVTVGTTVSNAGTATLNITPVNVAPVAANDSFSAIANTPVTLDVLSNDTDVNGVANIAGIVIDTQPAAGATATLSGKNVIFNATASGTYTFTYHAVDAGILGSPALSSAPATVTVQVAAAEVITITAGTAQYIRDKARLRVSGTLSPAAGQTVRVDFVNNVGTVLGTAGTVASAAGAWAFDQSGVALPVGAVTLKATTSNGTSTAAALQIK